MSQPFKDLPGMIRYLARRHHGGKIYPMAKQLNVSSGLVYQWRDGTVKQPEDETVLRICETYRLDQRHVFSILTGLKLHAPEQSKDDTAPPFEKPTLDGMTQLQAVADAKGALKAVIGYRGGAIWYGKVRSNGPGEFKLVWHVMEGELAK